MARQLVFGVLSLVVLPLVAFAQTTSTPGIDVEIYNPEDGSHRFCPAPGVSFWVNVLVRPGATSTSCDLGCGTPVPGGSAALATGVIDVAFDTSLLEVAAVELNPATVASQALVQNNSSEGRVGWALAGNWSTPGDPSSALVGPCAMEFLDSDDWVYRIQFHVPLDASGSGDLRLRRPPAFDLSFADICGSEAFTILNGGIDEVVDATVYVNVPCGELIFSDDFESGDTGSWSAVQGP